MSSASSASSACAYARAIWRTRWLLLSGGLAGVALLSVHCGGGKTAVTSPSTSATPRIIAKTAVPGELAPVSSTASAAPTATAVIVPVREQELREGFAARQYFIGCYHEDLHRDRTSAGHITLGFLITPEGTLDKLEVTEKTGTLSDAFVKCLTTGVLRVTLKPRPGSEPIRLTYPFAFSSDFHTSPSANSASAKP